MKKRNRYPGSQPFETAQQDIFFGRDKDIADLTELIELEQSVVLYGKSGLGKSSLIEAGIVPRLLEKNEYLPIRIRFEAYREGATTHTPLTRAYAMLQSPDTWLNERFANTPRSLWHCLKNKQIRQESNGYLLVFDQFEELFTYPEEQVADFAQQLAEVQYTNIPERYRQQLEQGFAHTSDFLSDAQMRLLHQPVGLKTLMGIRSDRMSLMNKLKPYLPEVLVHTYELQALKTNQARAALREPAHRQGDFQIPPFEYDKNTMRRLLAYLTRDGEQLVESFQLQILAEYIERLIKHNNYPVVLPEHIGNHDAINAIFENHYLENINSLDHEKDRLAARKFIEEGLIFEAEERRLSLYEGQILKTYDLNRNLLRQLVNTHLLRAEPSMRGGYTYELSHDTLVEPVLKAKAERKKAETKTAALLAEQERQQEIADLQAEAEKERGLRKRANDFLKITVMLFLVAAALGVFGFLQYRSTQKALAEAEIQKEEALRQKGIAETKQKEADNSLLTAENAKNQTDSAFNVASRERDNAILQKSIAEKARGQADLASIEAQKERDNAIRQTEIAEKQRGIAEDALEDAETQKNKAEEQKREADTQAKIAKTAKDKAYTAQKNSEEQAQIAQNNADNLENVLDALYFYGDSLALAYRKNRLGTGLYGFMNKKGKALIDYKYTEALPFDGGYAEVKKWETSYLIDTEGNEYRFTKSIKQFDENIEAFDFGGQKEFNKSRIQQKIFSNTKLKILFLFGCDISPLLPEIRQLTALEKLNLSATDLLSLTPEIGELSSLKELNLSYTSLSFLPPEIGQLTSLKELNLSHTNLTSLPPEIEQLDSIETLNLSGTELSSIPPKIGQLTSLKELYLRGTAISFLPSEIKELKALKKLDLKNTNIPEEEKQKIKKLLPNCEIRF